MKFADFQHHRAQILRDQPSALDCAETNLYAALARLKPPETPAPEKTVHRCHLAAEWTDLFGLHSELSRRALISCGVRDSLALLFRHYARNGARLWLPSDNYPVYGELAKGAGLEPSEFQTFPEPIWPDAPPSSGDEILVVTNPLKPLGRWLTAADVSALKRWLASSLRRRVIVDSVYTFETRFHSTTLELLATGQAILLHSLTKGWLHPRLFGVALVPECDASTLAPLFRAQPPPQQNLAHARDLMRNHAGMPGDIAGALEAAYKGFLSALPSQIAPLTMNSAPGYFILVATPWIELLAQTNILGLPATVFGSSHQDITILSSLSFASPKLMNSNADTKYVVGDATAPEGAGTKVVVHVCNDIGGWGRGFVVALSRRWPEPEKAYRTWHSSGVAELPFALGEVQFVPVSDDTWVANMIAQHDIRAIGGVPPVRYEAIRATLSKVATFANAKQASVHMPRIGCGLAGGSWPQVEAIIRDELGSKGIAVYVYDLPPAQS